MQGQYRSVLPSSYSQNRNLPYKVNKNSYDQAVTLTRAKSISLLPSFMGFTSMTSKQQPTQTAEDSTAWSSFLP